VFMPHVPNQYDDDAQRTQRLEAQPEESLRHSLILLTCGLLSLVVFGVLAVLGTACLGPCSFRSASR
jgi:hypothetical protein